MKKIIVLFCVCLMLVGVMPAWAVNYDAGTKLGRGVNNLVFGWFEIINEIGNQADGHGLWIGVPAGFFRGLFFGIGRTLTGAWETVTFLFPNGKRGYAPLILPESVFARR